MFFQEIYTNLTYFGLNLIRLYSKTEENRIKSVLLVHKEGKCCQKSGMKKADFPDSS